MDLRVIGWLAVGTVLGFALGGLGPRRQLQTLAAENAVLTERLDRMRRPNPLSMFFPGFDTASDANTAEPPHTQRATQVEPASTAAPTEPDTPSADPPSRSDSGSVAVIGADAPAAHADASGTKTAPVPSTVETATAVPAATTTPRMPDEGQRPRGRTRLADFDRIASVQAARLSASRAALIAQAGLNEEQVAQVDGTIARMNDRLVGYGEEVITRMGSEEPPAPAAVLGLGHDVSGVLYEGQQELDQIVGQARDEVEPEALEIWNYVDVEQWRPFVDQQLSQQGGTPGVPAATGQAPRSGAPQSGSGGSEH